MKGVSLTGKKQSTNPNLGVKKIGPSNIAISLRYLSGFDASRYNAWHVGLLAAFHDIGRYDWDGLMAYKGNGFFQITEVCWDDEQMGHARGEWPLLSENYKENDKEFPLWHISIGHASGHVMGLLGSDSKTFYVLRIEPNRADVLCHPILNDGYNFEVTEIVEDGRAISQCTYKDECEARIVLRDIVKGLPYLYIKTDTDLAEKYHEMLQDGTLLKEF